MNPRHRCYPWHGCHPSHGQGGTPVIGATPVQFLFLFKRYIPSGRTMNATDPFDVERLRATSESMPVKTPTASTRPPRHKGNEPFLAGPIPWNWLIQAGRLPGCALLVGIVLWREVAMKRKGTVKFCLSHLSDFEKSPDAARRGLRELEAAKLVSVKHYPGKCLDVTILDVPADEPEIGMGVQKSPDRPSLDRPIA